MTGLASFPVAQAGGFATPSPLVALGFRLRPAIDADLPALRRVYADTRAEELAAVPWPAPARQAFLEQQFAAQHRHYLQVHPGAHFLVIEHRGEVEGRFYLQASPPDHLIVDISLMAAQRGKGVGTRLLEAAIDAATAQGQGMMLHVLRSNAGALRLYERLGFRVCESTDLYHRMRRPAGPAGESVS